MHHQTGRMPFTKFLWILVILLYFMSVPLVVTAYESSAARSTPSSLSNLEKDIYQAAIPYRQPNYIFLMGLRGAYFYTTGVFSAYLDEHSFSPSLYMMGNPAWFDGFSIGVDIAFHPQYLAVNENSYNLSLGVTAGPVYSIPIIEGLNFNIYAYFGMMFSFFKGENSGNIKQTFYNPLGKFGLEIEYELFYHSAIVLGLNYQTMFQTDSLSGLSVYGGYNFRIGGLPSEEQLEVSHYEMKPLFPVLKNAYRTHIPVASISIKNVGEGYITNIRASYYVENYMETVTINPELYELEKGENLVIPLYAQFTSKIQENENDIFVDAFIILRYEIEDKTYYKQKTLSIPLYDKNKILLQDADQVAAFISPVDPAIHYLSHRMELNLSQFSEYPAIPPNIKKAIAAFDLIKSFGLKYRTSDHPFNLDMVSRASEEEAAPMLSFRYAAEVLDPQREYGVEKDFALLYINLLEALNVPTALIITGKNLMVMFSTGIDSSSYEVVSENQSSLIVYEDKVWIPLRTSYLAENEPNFNQSWTSAINEYNIHSNRLKILEIRDGWEKYPPSEIALPYETVQEPDWNLLQTRYQETLLLYSSEHRREF